MKHTSLTRMGLATLILVALTAPANAQNLSQLKQENARLKAQIEILQAQDCGTSPRAGHDWKQGDLSATIDTIRVGGRQDRREAHITTTLTLRNTGRVPMSLNYKSRSFKLVDDLGYAYALPMSKSVAGIPIAYEHQADATAIIGPGESRTVTFSAQRTMARGETPGRTFDLNASFIQIEDQGQGKIRKVRDYSAGFTNVPASGL